MSAREMLESAFTYYASCWEIHCGVKLKAG
jgi:hypothetical protein